MEKMENMEAAHPLMLIEEVAQMLRLSHQTVARYAKKKKLPAFKVGYIWRFRRNEIEKIASGDVESPRGDYERGAALQTGTD
jgi:PTS system nitrogen regulatory IIA component